MIVTASNMLGTIGGGHLEFKAIDIARHMILTSNARALHRFVLGATLGQCCGGVMNLTFEAVADDAALTEYRSESAPDFHLVLFGAGHVGRAVVRILSELSCAITWVDGREEAFPKDLPFNVQRICTDEPTCEVDAAGAGSYFLVMTHSHVLDQRLTEAIMARSDVGWFGLIGSNTKRKQFEHRLQARGVDAARIGAMVCPIGLPGIANKAPAVIAASVAAQLLMVWEAADPDGAGKPISSPRS